MRRKGRMRIVAGLCLLLPLASGCQNMEVMQAQVMQFVDQLRPAGSKAEEGAIAQRYLQADETVEIGIDVFEVRVQRDPQNAGIRLGLARMYLADDQPAKALPHLEAAARIEPGFETLFWLGVAQGATGQAAKERRSYQHALKHDPREPRAWTYLGHNQLEGGEYSEALRSYDKALALEPVNAQALFNRAAILQQQGRTKEARQAWHTYLNRFPTGDLAIEAVNRLNAGGDFSYRNHPIGDALIPLPQPKFASGKAELDGAFCNSLEPVRESFSQIPDMQLHVIVYVKGNRRLAAERASALRQCLLGGEPQLEPQRVHASWFDAAEVVPIGKKKQPLDFSVQLFTAAES